LRSSAEDPLPEATSEAFRRRLKPEEISLEPHPSSASTSSYAPYADEATNALYNLLFCDLVDAFRPSRDHEPAPWQRTLFRDPPDPAAWTVLAADETGDSRVRALACARLRAAGHPVPPRLLLGVVVEVGLDPGLDTLAAYRDRGVRYLHHSGRMSIVEGADTPLQPAVDALLAASATLVQRLEPSRVPRRPPPVRGSLRVTFIASEGTYWGEGPLAAMSADPMAAPVVERATRLLHAVVELGARPSHGAGGSATARDR
jgi:hypothetical protein